MPEHALHDRPVSAEKQHEVEHVSSLQPVDDASVDDAASSGGLPEDALLEDVLLVEEGDAWGGA